MELLGHFTGEPSPRIIFASLLLIGASRLFVGGWSAWDALVAGAVFALWPLHEWALHVYVLHAQPLRLFGRKFELKRLSGHAEHHRNPLAWKQSFIDPRVLVVAIAMHTVLWLVIAPLELALTGLTTTALLGLVYEWTHFLIHTDYRPRTRAFRRLWVSHRLHHFKNENYWYGVTMLSGDWLLGTQPDPAEVETSPICRTLGVEPDLVL